MVGRLRNIRVVLNKIERKKYFIKVGALAGKYLLYCQERLLSDERRPHKVGLNF